MSYHPQETSRDPEHINKKRKRISHESEELAWTAARCSRLLRSITHRIGALKKLVESNVSKERAKPMRTVEKRVASHWSTQDPVWIGDAKRKTGAKTFARKKKVAKQPPSQTSGKESSTTFPSPFVRRVVGGGIVGSPLVVSRPVPPPPRLTRQLPVKESPRLEAENGLLLAFESLLTATSGNSPQSQFGARSLMNTCLRNVPQYIEINREDEQCPNITSDVLSYLEEFGTKENGGWTGLREVVRSQAVFAVCQAIEEGILSENIICGLVEKCSMEHAIPEGQEILAVWIEAEAPVTSKQVATLNSFGREQICEAANYRVMRVVGEQDSAKAVSFCNSPRFWNNLLRSLASTAHYEAAEFTSILIRVCLEQETPRSTDLEVAVRETIMRLTTMAASSMLLDAEDHHESMCGIIYKLTADAVLGEHRFRSSELHHLLVSCSLFLLGVASKPHGIYTLSNLSTLLPSASKIRSHHFEFAAEIVSSLCVLEQHLHSDLPGLLLDRMVDRAGAAPLYREIAMAVVTAKQESGRSDENEALFANYVHRITLPSPKNGGHTPKTPSRTETNIRYRWEEGISEWVTKTPFAAVMAAPPKPSSTMLATPVFDNKENSSANQMSCCKSMKKEYSIPQNSPDVLAFSPRPLTVAESPSRPRKMKKARLSQANVGWPKKETQRRASRLSGGSRASPGDSADELGF